MNAYKCNAGHVNKLDFPPTRMKMKCPDCTTQVFKFRDRYFVDERISDAENGEIVLVGSGKHRITTRQIKMAGGVALVMVAILAYIGSAYDVLGLRSVVQGTVKLSALPASGKTLAADDAAQIEPGASAPQTAAPAETGNQVSPESAKGESGSAKVDFQKVEIRDLKVLEIVKDDKGSENIRFTFTLVNNGPKNTPFPDLEIRWKKSTAKNVILRADQYAHAVDEFTTVTITTELHKPPHARGIEMKIST